MSVIDERLNAIAVPDAELLDTLSDERQIPVDALIDAGCLTLIDEPGAVAERGYELPPHIGLCDYDSDSNLVSWQRVWTKASGRKQRYLSADGLPAPLWGRWHLDYVAQQTSAGNGMLNVVVCEGAMDYATMHYLSERDDVLAHCAVVGLSGTGQVARCAEEIIATSRRYDGLSAVCVVGLFDGDRAGITAAAELSEALRHTANVRLRMLVPPDGSDVSDLHCAGEVDIMGRVAQAAGDAVSRPQVRSAAAGIGGGSGSRMDAALRNAAKARLRRMSERQSADRRRITHTGAYGNRHYEPLTAEQVVEAAGAKKVGNSWRAPCPAHNGLKRNLSITATKRGSAIVVCHSRGCDWKDIYAALGLWREYDKPGTS